MTKRLWNRKVGVCAADKKIAVNAALDAAGFGPNNFDLPMHGEASDVSAKATHYMCSWRYPADHWAAIQAACEPHVTWHDEPNHGWGGMIRVMSLMGTKYKREG
jgi:hypothetical protein